MKRLSILFLLVIFAFGAKAQFTLNGEYRPRTEFLHGYKAPMANQGEMFNLVTTQRTRLGFFYNTTNYKFGVQVQDVRAWGATKQLVAGDGAYTTIHQAWGEILFNENLSLKVGRQELVYDDHRILGSVGWAQQARSHDLALLKYEKKGGFKLHFGTAVNQVQTRNYPVAGNYKSMQFLWFNKKMNDHLTLSLLALNNGVNDTTLNNVNGEAMTTYSQIVGLRPVYKSGKLSIAMNFYYQMGDFKGTYYDKTDQLNHHKKMSAYNLRFDVGYKLSDNLKLTLGYEMISGNSQTDTTTAYSQTNHAFTPLYGTNHKFNGWMDYFFVGNHVNSVGLNDAFIGLSYGKDKFLAGGQFHYFTSGADVFDAKEFASTGKIQAMPAGLGMELDTYIGYKFAPGVLLKAGVSGMFDSETMRAIKGGAYGASNYWGWMMIVVKPTFLNK